MEDKTSQTLFKMTASAPRKKRHKRRAFGTGSVYQKGGSWWISWRVGGKRRFERFTDESIAKAALRKHVLDTDADRGGLERDTRNAATLGELAAPWLERRAKTHRAASNDACRWRVHLLPYFGACKPHEVTPGKIRAFVELKLSQGLAATTAGHCVRLLSGLFCDLVEQGHATANPVASLPRSTRRLYRRGRSGRR